VGLQAIPRVCRLWCVFLVRGCGDGHAQSVYLDKESIFVLPLKMNDYLYCESCSKALFPIFLLSIDFVPSLFRSYQGPPRSPGARHVSSLSENQKSLFLILNLVWLNKAVAGLRINVDDK
jgi:hypothetical protein